MDNPKKNSKILIISNQDVCAEILLIIMACFAPWAYGSVDASSEYILYGGLLMVVVLRTIADHRTKERSLGSGPIYWALLAIVGIALLQVTPLNEQIIGFLSPGTSETRAEFVPKVAETLRGFPGPAVKPPEATISLEPSETWHGLVRLLAIFLLFDCASRSRLRFLTLKWFATILVVNSTVLSMYSLIQSLAWNGKIYWVRPALSSRLSWGVGGPFFCHNHLAANLNLSLGLALGLFFTSMEDKRRSGGWKFKRFLMIYAIGLIVVGIVASHSRGGVVAMVSSFLLVLAMFRIRPSRILPALAGILMLCIAFLMSIGSSSLVERLGSIPETLTTGLNGRADVWAGALKTWKNTPILGAGFGTFAEVVAPNYNPTDPMFFDRFAGHGESEYAEMLAEGGLVGLGLLLVILFDLLRKTLMVAKKGPPSTRPIILGCLFAISALATQSLADFPLHIAGVAVPAVILASKVYRLDPTEKPSKDADPRTSPALLRRGIVTLKNVLLLISGCLLIYHQAGQVKLEHLVENAGIPLPGTRGVTLGIPSLPRAKLDAMRIALTQALKIRPDWAEGHMRLGQIELGLYRHAAATALGIDLVTVDDVEDSEANARSTDSGALDTPDSKSTSPEDPFSNNDEPAEGSKSPSDKSSSKRPDTTITSRTLFDKLISYAPTLVDRSAARRDCRLPVTPSLGKPLEKSETPDTEAAPQKADESGTGTANVAAETSEESKESKEPSALEIQADPIWLHKIAATLRKKSPEEVRSLSEYEAVKEHLVPAARSFLEARRCCPLLGVPHLELAVLDYLFEDPSSSLECIRRGVALKGNHHRMLIMAGQLADNLDQKEMAVKYWHDYLDLRPKDWPLIADLVSNLLTTSQILEVAKGGGAESLLGIGTRLYSGPLGFISRAKFMESALAVLPLDSHVDDDERIWLEALIRGELSQYDRARVLMKQALALQPMNRDWRLICVSRLMAWGCYEEAHNVALVGANFFPKFSTFRNLARMSVEASAVDNLEER